MRAIHGDDDDEDDNDDEEWKEGDDVSGITGDDSQIEASQAEERCSCLIQYPLLGYIECVGDLVLHSGFQASADDACTDPGSVTVTRADMNGTHSSEAFC